MSGRLPRPWGSRLDRDEPVDFVFEGRGYMALKGDTIASALAANGRKVLSRSFKYHRPRGIVSMAGLEANTLVQVGDEPNVRADLRRVEPGMAVSAQNVFGSLSRDLGAVMGLFGRFMPVGFYYRSFYGPRRSSWLKLWEPLIRRAAGLGKVGFAPAPVEYRKRSLHCDVLVVGAGPAGLSAALKAADQGLDVVIADQNPETGGSLTYARFDVEGKAAGEALRTLRESVDAHPRIRVLREATCNGWYADNWLPVIQHDVLFKVRAAEVVLAAGSQEQPLTFTNNDLPGILYSSAAQRLMRHYAVRPGERAVVFAGALDGYRAALDLAEVGIAVEAVIEPETHGWAEAWRAALRARGIRLVEGARIVEAHGRSQVKAVTVAVGASGRERIACDLLVTAAGYTPTYQLALQAGATLGHDDATGRFRLEKVPAHMHLAGSMAGVFDLDAVIRSGEIAGLNAARSFGCAGTPALAAIEDAPGAAANYRPLPDIHPKGHDFIDFDEDLTSADIRNAVADGYSELELVKRFSTVGMGPSQGRHSALGAARIVAAATSRSVGAVGITTARPPFGPERLGLLAGPKHDHYRHTALHDDLVAAGARMIPMGAWWRPSFFSDGGDAGPAIEAEVKAVRNGVAMLDVSTLGKMAVRGPDAGAFLDRFYTMLHSSQPVGKVRYCLMLNEMGSVVDDGVAFRLAPDHYHVTTTTGAAARVHAQMTWWNAQWKLDVDIQNVTGAFAGINVTGPLARDALSALDGDIDFSRAAFGFLDGRSGTLAGSPVLAMRIGFTGELSYELHVPHSAARQLWQALAEAGIRPYGLEASRILRLEKGHIIIGQDTDAMTTPDELSMEWALSRKKPFFLGRTALEQRRRFQMTRKLCGFRHEGVPAGTIAEGCLVLKDGRPVGYVSSIAWSPTLKATIGLAYAHPDDAAPGGGIGIRALDGRTIVAPVVSPHFYDPQNDRQDL